MQLNALFVRLRSTFKISYATRPISARAIIYQWFGWSFFYLSTNDFVTAPSWGLTFTCLIIINAIVHFGDVRLSTDYLFIFSQISTYICGPYQISTIIIIIQLQRL
jgi:hypothetical protein